MMLGIPVPCSKYYNYYSDTNTKVSIIAPYIMMLYRYYTFSRPLLSKYYSDTNTKTLYDSPIHYDARYSRPLL